VEVEGPGSIRLRAHLANRGQRTAEVVLSGPSAYLTWSLQPGEDRAVEVELGPGLHRLAGERGVVAGEPRLGRALEHPRLLVLALADTLRDDHVEPATTPQILAAFEDGRRWTDVTANAPWTLPSVASFFTSRPVLDLSLPEGGLIGLPEGVRSWAERLEGAGFAGGGVVANYTVHAQNGYARGFVSYRVPAARGKTAVPDAAWVVEEAGRFLAEHQGEDAFLYLHFMDPHEPFRDHGAGLPTPPSMAVLSHRERPATAEERALVRTLYRGEVRHLDEVAGPFLRRLPASATVAFTADHGEALGEHTVWGHALSLYQEVVAVPLLLRGPGIDPGREERPVQLLDLVPTLLATVGVGPAAGMQGRSLLEEPAGGSAIVTATFSPGPLRWAWRARRRKVVLRTAPQSQGASGRRDVVEEDPLAVGAFVRTQPGDEDDDVVLSAEQAPEVARVFAGSAGRLVPGLTVMMVGESRPVELAFEGPADLEPVQLWGFGPLEVSHQEGRWTVRAATAQPLAAVSFRAGAGKRTATPLAGGVPWAHQPPGQAVGDLEEEQPHIDRPGAYLWWNGERRIEVEGQRATEERLRALGYL
jgi:arylsulfatase A-like enzyme